VAVPIVGWPRLRAAFAEGVADDVERLRALTGLDLPGWPG
jgi:hypothetical protein